MQVMMRGRGLSIDHTTIYRWVQHSAPELEKRCRPHLKACYDSWKVDETHIKVKKIWMYLYRAVDSEGNTLTRDAEAAKRFFLKALHATTDSTPQTLPCQERIASADPITTSVPRVRTFKTRLS